LVTWCVRERISCHSGSGTLGSVAGVFSGSGRMASCVQFLEFFMIGSLRWKFLAVDIRLFSYGVMWCDIVVIMRSPILLCSSSFGLGATY
jgi:hypothetical protein